MLLERWESQVAPLTGCKSYEEMAAGLRVCLRLRAASAGLRVLRAHKHEAECA